MKTFKIKKNMYMLLVVCFFLQGFFYAACDDWTEIEAENYFESNSKEYYDNLKEYFQSPHKLMFGWFGNWTGKSGSSRQYALVGLPDSVDFVSLWLCWGNLTQAQQDDLKEFQERGSKAVLCWLPTSIGENITPGGHEDQENVNNFWGIDPSDENTYIEAARKYALAIVDTCNKYNIDGFDADIESNGTLINSSHPERFNTFMRTLREEFDKTGKMLVADIPGGTGWLHFYGMLADDVVESLDYIVWQTYELGHSGLDNFFSGAYGVKSYHPDLFESVLKKSIITATFERATDKHYFSEQQTYHPSCGIEHAGMGAYHIEYDYPGAPDYPTVRAAIAAQNEPTSEK